MKSLFLCVALLGLVACADKPTVKGSAPASSAKTPATSAKSAPAKAKSPGSKQATTRRPNKKVKRPKKISSLKKKPIEWDGPLKWMGWDDGIKAAKAQNKPICLVLYADWCPRCKDLAPVFNEGEIAKLGGEMIMVKQNVDDRPAWLEDYKSLGTYVPRVFFFDAEGNIKDDLTSSHSRYPYFYTPAGKKALAESMRKALGKS